MFVAGRKRRGISRELALEPYDCRTRNRSTDNQIGKVRPLKSYNKLTPLATVFLDV